MREFLALTRAGWQSAVTYRLAMIFSLAGLLVTLVPVYFVAKALQPMAARSIAGEGGDYFAFLVVGLIATTVVATAVMSPGAALTGAIGSGTLESVLVTPAHPFGVFLGLVGYDLSWAAIKAAFVIVMGTIFGLTVLAPGLATAAVAVVLMLVCHLGLGFGLAAMVVAFRTSGPLGPAILTASTLLGGVYYSTTVIPSWIQQLSAWVPLTYSLRAMRRGLLEGETLAAAAPDLMRASAFAVAGAAIGMISMSLALRHARRAGLLGRE